MAFHLLWQHSLKVEEAPEALCNHLFDMLIPLFFVAMGTLGKILLEDDLLRMLLPGACVEQQIQELEGFDRKAGGETQCAGGSDGHALFASIRGAYRVVGDPEPALQEALK